MPDQELDVRPLPKPDKHPRIFQLFGALAVSESFVLVNNHDPRHLRREFETEYPAGFGWDYLDRGPAAGFVVRSPGGAAECTPAKSPPGRTIPARQAPSGNWR